MSVNWTTHIDSGLLDVRDQPIQYRFTYLVGGLLTKVEMATNQYEWTGEREFEASSVLLESLMTIEHSGEFLASEYKAWEETCQYWANKN